MARYSLIEHIAKISQGSEWRTCRLAVFSAYFDASGDIHSSKALAMAGFVGPASTWIEWERNWLDRLHKDGLTEFHRNELGGMEADKRLNLLEDLAVIIQEHGFFRFGVAIINQDLNKITNAKDRQRWHINSYSYAGQCAATEVNQWRLTWSGPFPELIFERGDTGRGLLIHALRRNGYPEPIFKPKRDTVHKKTGILQRAVIPLQAADLYAYDLFSRARDIANGADRFLNLYSINENRYRYLHSLKYLFTCPRGIIAKKLEIHLFFAYNKPMALTKRQKEFLDFLAGFLEKRGYSPSYEEIADGLNLASLATVHKHILALETKHYVTRGFNQSRSLEISAKYYEEQRQHRQQPASFEIPLLGRIAAGAPVEAIAGRDTLNFSDFTGDPGTYALQVRGESMIEDHICDGDYVLVEHASEARDGDIVVALVDGLETTLKRFYLEAGDRVRLQPANASMQPIFVPRASVVIQGKVLAVLRKY